MGHHFRIIAFPFLLCLLTIKFSAFAQNTGARSIVSINDNWKFAGSGMAYAQDPGFDDTKWERVNLPHTWNALDPFDDDETYMRGIGWYRKKINLDTALRCQKFFLFFEGANEVADVYINGAFAGQHKGGYTGFSIDITPFLNWKEKAINTIAVQVNNVHDNFIPPLSVGYALYGGIYRNVWLITTADIHFKEINNSAAGVFIETRDVTSGKPTLSVKSTLINESSTRKDIIVQHTITEADGKIISEFSNNMTIEPGQEKNIQSTSPEIVGPHLWTPEDPYLYHLQTNIIENNRIIDQVVNPIGFRWFRFSPDSGFFLNGKKYILHGVNRHQDMMGKGSALSEEDHVRDMQMIKNMGANFIRLAHYPQAPSVLAQADKLGLLIWEEIPLVDYMNVNQEFLLNAENMLREMIHQHFNHPSIIIWGSMNEILLHSMYGERIQKHDDDSMYVLGVRNYELKLDSMIRAEDPSRYTTMAMHQSSDYAKYKLDNISQIGGYNIYSGWYNGKTEDFGNALDNIHQNKPQQIIFVSEYGAEGEIQLNTEDPQRMDYTGQYQRLYHESYLRQIYQRPFLAGTAVWNEFDFSQPNIGGPTPHRNQKGLVTWDRKPKDVYYLYKANWNPAPMIYIASRNWLVRSGEQSAFSTIDVYSNLDKVTLYVNNIAQPSQVPNDIKKVSWKVHLKNGTNIISAQEKINGKIISDQIELVYKAYDPVIADKGNDPGAININSGSNAEYLDPAGTVWIADRAYVTGSFGYTGGTAQNFSRTKVIKNTTDVPLYYSSRDSLQSYKFDLPDGKYGVTLYFVENKDIAPGARIFSVAMNGTTIIRDMDLAAAYGYAVAAKRTFIVDIKDRLGLNVSFIASKGNTLLSGISVEKK